MTIEIKRWTDDKLLYTAEGEPAPKEETDE